MGCFNTSCFVSNQIVAPNDAVLLMPILQVETYDSVNMKLGEKKYTLQSYAGSTCYASAFWEPCGAFIKAIYDDYGRFNLINEDLNITHVRTFFNFLYEKSPIIEQGKDKRRHLDFDFKSVYSPKETYTFEKIQEVWDYMWDRVQRYRLFAAKWNGEPRPLSFAIMHQYLEDYLTDLVETRTDWGDDRKFDKLSVFGRLVNSAFQIRLKIDTEDGRKFRSYSLAEAIGKLDDRRLFDGNHHLQSHYGYDYNTLVNYLEKQIPIILEEKRDFFNEEELKYLMTFVTPLLNACYIMSGLEMIGIRFSPMVYSDQDYQNDQGKIYAKLVADICEKVCNFRKELYGDDYEDDEEFVEEE